MGISVVYSTETGYTIFVHKGITMFSPLTVPRSLTPCFLCTQLIS